MKKALTFILAAALFTGAMSGCGGNNTSSTTDSSTTSTTSTETSASAEETSEAEATTGETVTMTYVVPGDAPPDVDGGLKAVNEKMAADGVGVELSLKYIPWDAWDQKINLMLATGEKFDAFHVMADRVTLPSYVSKNALADLTSIMDEYGSSIVENNPSLAMDSCKVGGSLYAIPAFWVETALNHQGTIRLDIMEKYGITEVPTNYEELTAAYETVMANWDGVQKPYLPVTPNFSGERLCYALSDDTNFTLYENCVYVGQDGTITNYYKTDAFKQMCERSREWYEKGFINPDILTVTADQNAQRLNSGDWFVSFGTLGSIVSLQQNYPDLTVEDFGWLDIHGGATEIRPYGVKNMNAVPRASEHPEAAVKFFNWVYSSQENYDLFIYGREGTDYKTLEGKNYEPILDAQNKVPYNFATWMAGNINYTRTDAAAPLITNEHLYQTDENAVDGYAATFTFDASSLQTEYADVQTQISAVIQPMAWGVVDYESNIDNALELLDKAGIEKIVEEFKNQLEASK